MKTTKLLTLLVAIFAITAMLLTNSCAKYQLQKVEPPKIDTTWLVDAGYQKDSNTYIYRLDVIDSTCMSFQLLLAPAYRSEPREELWLLSVTQPNNIVHLACLHYRDDLTRWHEFLKINKTIP